MKIYIIRHGETAVNARGVLQGWIDEELNESGRELARLTGQAMKGIRFDGCIASPLIRAKETAEIILRESENSIPVITDDRLREMSFGEMEARDLCEMGYEGLLFYTDPFRFAGFPKGETFQEMCCRTQTFLRELIARDDGKTYLIGTHGCALRAMLNFLYEDPADFWHGHVPYNCAVTIVEAEGGRARITADDKIYYDQSLIVEYYGKLEQLKRRFGKE